MHETTLRVFSALRERIRDEDAEDFQTLNNIARDAGLTLDEAANALDRLETVGAVASTEDDEMVYRPRDVTVGTVADRMAALHRVPDSRRDEVVDRLKSGEIDPGSLPPLVEALGIGAASTADQPAAAADGSPDESAATAADAASDAANSADSSSDDGSDDSGDESGDASGENAGDDENGGGENASRSTMSPLERLVRFVPGS